LIRHLDHVVTYEDPALLITKGKVVFSSAPEIAAGRDFRLDIAPVTLFLYSPFSAFLAASGGGYDKVVFSDQDGRILGNVGDAYPNTRLDFLTGRYIIQLSSPDESGRRITVSYDTPVASRCRNIPIGHNIMPTFSTISLTEINRPVNL